MTVTAKILSGRGLEHSGLGLQFRSGSAFSEPLQLAGSGLPRVSYSWASADRNVQFLVICFSFRGFVWPVHFIRQVMAFGHGLGHK